MGRLPVIAGVIGMTLALRAECIDSAAMTCAAVSDITLVYSSQNLPVEVIAALGERKVRRVPSSEAFPSKERSELTQMLRFSHPRP